MGLLYILSRACVQSNKVVFFGQNVKNKLSSQTIYRPRGLTLFRLGIRAGHGRHTALNLVHIYTLIVRSKSFIFMGKLHIPILHDVSFISEKN